MSESLPTTTVTDLAAAWQDAYDADTHTSARDLALIASDLVAIVTEDEVEDMADRLFDRQCYGDSLEDLARIVLEEWTCMYSWNEEHHAVPAGSIPTTAFFEEVPIEAAWMEYQESLWLTPTFVEGR